MSLIDTATDAVAGSTHGFVTGHCFLPCLRSQIQRCDVFIICSLCCAPAGTPTLPELRSGANLLSASKCNCSAEYCKAVSNGRITLASTNGSTSSVVDLVGTLPPSPYLSLANSPNMQCNNRSDPADPCKNRVGALRMAGHASCRSTYARLLCSLCASYSGIKPPLKCHVFW